MLYLFLILKFSYINYTPFLRLFNLWYSLPEYLAIPGIEIQDRLTQSPLFFQASYSETNMQQFL